MLFRSIFGQLNYNYRIALYTVKNIRSLFLAVCIFLCTLAAASNTEQQCEALINRGIAAMHQKKYARSLELLTKARELAEKNHLDKQLFLALMNIGNNYHYIFDYGEALDYFLESYTVAMRLEPQYEIMIVHNIANMYALEDDYVKAGIYYRKAYETAKKHNAGDKLIGMSLSGLAYTMMQKGDIAGSRKYITKSLEYLKGWPKEELATRIMLINNTLMMGNPSKAREEAVQLYTTTPDLSYDDTEVNLQLVISDSYLAEGNYKEAIAYAQKILASGPGLDSRQEAYLLLADIYTKSNDILKALQYKDSVFNTQQELNAIKNGRLFESNKVKFEIKQYKSEIAANEQKLGFERMLFYFAMAVALSVIVIGFLVFKQKRIEAARNRQLMLFDLEKEKNNSLMLEKQLTVGLLEQERLKNEVDARNRKLSAKALHLSGRNALIEEIMEHLSKRPKYSKDTTLAAYIESLRQHLRTDNDWNDFIAHFEEVNSGFLSRLKAAHPNLTVNDIRFIAYMYMKLSVKEIAYLLNITPLAAKKRKERLAAKMEIYKDTDLYDYIAVL